MSRRSRLLVATIATVVAAPPLPFLEMLVNSHSGVTCRYALEQLVNHTASKRVAYVAVARTGSQSLQHGISQLYTYTRRAPHDHDCSLRDLEMAGATHVMISIRHPAARILSGVRRRLENNSMENSSNKAFVETFGGAEAANAYIHAIRSPQSPTHGMAMNITLGHGHMNFMMPIDEYYLRGAHGSARVEYVCTENLTADFDRIAALWQLGITLPTDTQENHRSTSHASPLDQMNLAWVESTYAADLRLWKTHCNSTPAWPSPLPPSPSSPTLSAMATVASPAARDHPAHAVIVYGDREHACLAAVLGQQLRKLDPTRARIALVYNVSAITKEVLVGAGWELHPFEMLHPNGSIGRRSENNEKYAARKLPLWSLTNTRVLFWDTDHIVLLGNGSQVAERRARLQTLWKSKASTLVATHYNYDKYEPAAKCFNSGFMLLWPSPAESQRLRHFVFQPPQEHEFTRCPRGHDQPLLNYAFPNWTEACPTTDRQKDGMPPCLWRVAMSSSTLERAPPGATFDLFDSVHYRGAFSLISPWTMASHIPVHRQIATEWWAGFDALPSFVRSACLSRGRLTRMYPA